MAKFGNDVLRVTPDGGSEFYVEGVADHTTDRNSQVNQADTGRPYGAEATIGFQAPTMRFTTEDLGNLITEMSAINGLCYDTNGTPGLVMYQNRHDRCAANGRGVSTNMSTTSAMGHLLIESIRGSSGQNAQASLIAHPLSATGEADPLAVVFNGSLPSFTISEEAWRIAGVVIAGTFHDSITDLNIAFNHQTNKPNHASYTYATEFDWQKATPTISMTFDDPEEVFAISPGMGLGPLGLRVTSANTYIQFRRADNATTGGPEAPASSAHLRCGINGLLHSTTPFSASGSQTGTTQLEIVTTENTTGVPLVWLTGQALTQA